MCDDVSNEVDIFSFMYIYLIHPTKTGINLVKVFTNRYSIPAKLKKKKKSLETKAGLSLISRILQTEFDISCDTFALKLAYVLRSDRP